MQVQQQPREQLWCACKAGWRAVLAVRMCAQVSLEEEDEAREPGADPRVTYHESLVARYTPPGGSGSRWWQRRLHHMDIRPLVVDWHRKPLPFGRVFEHTLAGADVKPAGKVQSEAGDDLEPTHGEVRGLVLAVEHACGAARRWGRAAAACGWAHGRGLAA